MTYAHVVAGAIVETASSVPTRLVRTSDGAKVLSSPYITTAELAACGWHVVVAVPRPADTPTVTFDFTIALVAGVPTEVWTQRAKTTEELLTQSRTANQTALSDLAALQLKMANLKSFLTDPDVDVALNQANATPLTVTQQNRFNKAIGRQLRRAANFELTLARLELGDIHPVLLDDISDTSGAA